ncbi:MAG: hypothetical protein KAI43_09975 [Candidatus Aureabacteria bacterium]|nr:hypothetical protein [Candidatus Auribacterota bacterium]
MKKVLSLILMVTFLFSFTSCLYAQGSTGNFGVSLEYWMTKFEGETKARGGTTIKYVDDINAEDEDNIIKFNFSLALSGNSDIAVSFYSLSYAGTNILTKNIIFNGVTYPVGIAANGKVESDIFDIKYRLYPLSSNEAQLGLVLGIKYAKTNSKLTSAALGTQTANIDIAVPQIGGIIKANINNIRLMAEFSGLSLSYQDSSGTIWELDLRAEYDIMPNFGIIGGYRYFKLDVEQDDDTAEFSVKGLYAGGIVRF